MPPNSWPRAMGVASMRCVRPIFSTFSHSLALAPEPRRIRGKAGMSWSRIAREHGHMDRGGEHVVGALAHVHVVVGGGSTFLASNLSPPASSIARLAITSLTFHVRRGAGTGLVDVDGELAVELAFRHFASRVQTGASTCLSLSGFLPVPVSLPRSRLAPAAAHLTRAKAMNQLRRHGLPGDWKFSTARLVWAPK